jgi:hypothetical protein
MDTRSPETVIGSGAGRRPVVATASGEVAVGVAWKPPGLAAAARTWEVVVDGEAGRPELRGGDQHREVLVPPGAPVSTRIEDERRVVHHQFHAHLRRVAHLLAFPSASEPALIPACMLSV